ncbi:hypothetical protein ACKWCC_06345, partial [Maribacter sp. 2307ULW6-5]
TNIPADIADGDDDTQLTDAQVASAVNNEFPNLDTDATDDFDGAWGSLTGIPADIADGDDDTQLTDAQVATAVNNEFPNLDTDATDDFDGAWGSLSGIPTNLDLDATDDFDGDWNSLSNIPTDIADGDDDTQLTDAQVATAVNNEFPNLDTDATDDFDGAWGSLTGIPANLDLDATDDFDGDWGSLTNIPADIADGDDDTTYTAGTGLTLTGTAFSVDNLAGEVTGPTNATVIADDAITAAKIADGAITGGPGGPIADNSITASDLATDSVDRGEIRADAVGNSELRADAVETENILDGNVTPAKIAPGANNQVLVTNASGTVAWETPTTDTTTNLTQDTATGQITYTNEVSSNQTANTVGAETNNSISVGANGGAFYVSPIKAFGKVSAIGSVVKATPGISVTKLGGSGHYRVTLPAGTVSDANYIIQLSQPGRNGAGNDDPGISYSNQTATSFEVIVGDNDNGGTDRSRFDSEFMFTILDL